MICPLCKRDETEYIFNDGEDTTKCCYFCLLSMLQGILNPGGLEYLYQKVRKQDPKVFYHAIECDLCGNPTTHVLNEDESLCSDCFSRTVTQHDSYSVRKV